MRILLTGGTGQVGRALLTALAPHADVIVANRSTFDLTQPKQIKASVLEQRPDLIVNAAAYTDVEHAELDEETAMMVNGVSVGELAAAARELRAPLLHYSTDYVFDGVKTSPYVEEDDTGPLSAYGRSKLSGEIRIREAGCAHLIMRTSWIYAASGRNFLTTMLRLAKERDELRVVDDQFGAPTFAGFIAAATAQIIEEINSSVAARRRVEKGDTLHVANGGVTNWFSLACAIFESDTVRHHVRPPRLIPIKSSELLARARRPLNSRLSTEKARTVWKLHVPDWRTSLDECLAQLPQR